MADNILNRPQVPIGSGIMNVNEPRVQYPELTHARTKIGELDLAIGNAHGAMEQLEKFRDGINSEINETVSRYHAVLQSIMNKNLIPTAVPAQERSRY